MGIVKEILNYREYYGDRIAWKVGDLTGDEPYGLNEGQFSVKLDINVDSQVFAEYAHNPWRTVARYLDHSFSVMVWRWGIWVAIRAKEVTR